MIPQAACHLFAYSLCVICDVPVPGRHRQRVFLRSYQSGDGLVDPDEGRHSDDAAQHGEHADEAGVVRLLVVQLGDLGDDHAGGGTGSQQGDHDDLLGAGQQGVQPQQQENGQHDEGIDDEAVQRDDQHPGHLLQVQVGDGGEGDAVVFFNPIIV